MTKDVIQFLWATTDSGSTETGSTYNIPGIDSSSSVHKLESAAWGVSIEKYENEMLLLVSTWP